MCRTDVPLEKRFVCGHRFSDAAKRRKETNGFSR
jgi:hypothetical protein